MAGFDHGPNQQEDEQASVIARNSRWGLRLFAVYLALYVGFMLLSAFWPSTLEMIVLAGVNLAIVYGMGLIFAAIFLALVYSWVCRASAVPADGDSSGAGSRGVAR